MSQGRCFRQVGYIGCWMGGDVQALIEGVVSL